MTSGSLVICSVVRVEPSVFVCVCTTSVPLLTVTVSLSWPSSSLTFTCAAVAGVQANVGERDGFESLQRDGHRVAADGHRRDREDAAIVGHGGERGARFVSFGDDVGARKNGAGRIGDGSRERRRHLPVGHGRRRDRRKT